MKTSRWPISHLPISGVTPFTYRDGETYLSMLNRLAQYVTEQLHPSLRETVEHMVEELEHILAAQHSKYVEGIQDFQRIHDAFMTDVNSALMALNDNAVSDLAEDAGSALGETLRELFATDGDFQDFKEHIEATTQVASTTHTDIYVATNGADENSGTTEQAPVRTLGRAVALIPDVIQRGHVFTVHVGIGDWNETLRLENRTVHGHLIFQGTTTNREFHRVLDVRVNDVSGHVTFDRIWATKNTQQGPKFWFQRSQPFMEVINCGNELVPGDTDEDDDGARGVHGVLADYGSKVSVQDSHFQGNRYGIRSNWFSQILSRDNTGDDNTHGIGARFGGIISLHGTQPTGTFINTTASSGGIVAHSTGGELGSNAHPEDGSQEHLSLVSYDRQRASPHHILTKRWSLRQGNQTYGVSNIPAGQTLRLEFRMNTHISVPLMINIEFSYQAGGGRHFTKCVANPMMTTTEVRNPEVFDIATAHGSTHNLEEMVKIRHSGQDGVFYIDLKPNPDTGASAGQHGENIEISSMRPSPAPTFVGARLVSE